ncbi:hypothetical protein LCGC14_1756160 [marine sediment metagenome]|uniref:Uncharacterized protein n=1 Tax=marine sediment metagenome TaxID=412755 RepID=A0A0F9HPQ0_9ZZZZ
MPDVQRRESEITICPSYIYSRICLRIKLQIGGASRALACGERACQGRPAGMDDPACLAPARQHRAGLARRNEASQPGQEYVEWRPG